MKLFVFLIIILTSFSSYAIENCTFGQKDMIVISWTGECKYSAVSGVGEMRVNDVGYIPGKQIKRKLYGKFVQGARVGLSLDLPYEVDNVPTSYQTGWFRFDDTDGNPSLIPVVFKVPDPNPDKIQDFTKLNWHPVVDNNPDYSKTISFEQAFEEIRRYVKAQNTESINLSVFKSYLQSNQNSKLVDDPPVAGIKLSLGGEAKPKKKSKKKKN